MNLIIWFFYILLTTVVSFRNQISKYLGLNIDWHLMFHIYVLITCIIAFVSFLFNLFIRPYIVKIKKYEIAFIMILLLVSIIGFFYKEPFVTYWGLFEYTYIFIGGYLLSYFSISDKNAKIIIQIFEVWTWFFVGIAIFQSVEFLLYYKFEILPFAVFKSHNLNKPDLVRLGLLRSPSLMGSPTEWGSVAMLYLLMSLYKRNFKFKLDSWIIILSLFITVTRSVYLCVLVILGIVFLLFFKELRIQRTTFLIVSFYLFLIIILFIAVGVNFIYSISKKPEFLVKDHLRGYGLFVAKQIPNKLFGLGPGRFGSYVSFKTNSSYLYSYGLVKIFKDIWRIKTIDSFWIQTFIEMGWIGVILMLCLFYINYKMLLYGFSKISTDHFMKSVVFSTIFIPFIYIVNGTAFSTFIPSFVGWSFILMGISLNYIRKL